MYKRLVVGIDEAGRGALAGPVAVGMCAFTPDLDLSIFPYINDSKKLSSHQREETFRVIRAEAKAGNLFYKVALVGEGIIDREGITRAVKRGVRRVLSDVLEDCDVYLDGLLRAPRRFKRQETVVGGDSLIPAISLASIAAKVVRDRKMTRLGRRYPEYGFEAHKGYGTKQHRKCLAEIGISSIHRATYCSIDRV